MCPAKGGGYVIAWSKKRIRPYRGSVEGALAVGFKNELFSKRLGATIMAKGFVWVRQVLISLEILS